MCRLFLVYSPHSPELAKKTTIALCLFSYNAGNRHGYFAMASSDFGKPTNKIVRTLSWSNYVRTLLSWWQGTATDPRIVYCHLRLASAGSISLENVHGFEVLIRGKRYRLAMNGHYGSYSTYYYYYRYYSSYPYYYDKQVEVEDVSEEDEEERKSGLSDTAILAKYINKHGDVVEGFEEFRKKYYGSAATFIVAEDFSDMYIIVDRHPVYLYKLLFEEPAGKVFVLTSMQDIVEKLIDRTKVTIKLVSNHRRAEMWLLGRTETTKVTKKTFRYRVKEAYYIELSSGIYHLDFINRRFEQITELE